jgi:hypothetical protein
MVAVQGLRRGSAQAKAVARARVGTLGGAAAA